MKQSLNEMAKDIHELAVKKGWWNGGVGKSLPEILMLCVSELSEALEEHRNASPPFYMGCKLGLICTPAALEGRTCPDRTLDAAAAGEPCNYSTGKPQGVAVELADCIIRILDYCAWAGIDIEEVIITKHEYNKSRPYRHGGKVC